MIYANVRLLHPWLDYLAAVVLLITGFSLVGAGQFIGLVQIVVGLAIALSRVAAAQGVAGTDRT